MKKLDHTPGPWIHDKRSFGSRITAPKMDVHYANGDIPVIARVYRHKQAKKIKCYMNDIEADANATLIASAPDMLESLLSLYVEICSIARLQDWHSDQFKDKIQNARETIEKATGIKIEEIES